MNRRFINLLLVLVGFACSCLAQATYEFTNIDPPGATFTQAFGINNSGQVVGNSTTGTGGVSFLYDSKKGGFTTITPALGSVETAVLGINESGVMAGGVYDGVTDSAFVRSKKGAYTVFSHPDCEITSGRAISSTGLVTGFALDCIASDSVGFIYDPASGNFIDFLPSPITIAQGINARGQVVGSTYLLVDGAYLGSPEGLYGFLRDTNGAIKLFRVNGSDSRGRGITDSGLITGFVNDVNDGGVAKGFVASLSAGPGYQSLTIPAADLLVAFPGATATFAQAINNAGVIAGQWIDAGGVSHGFIATPLPPKKK